MQTGKASPAARWLFARAGRWGALALLATVCVPFGGLQAEDRAGKWQLRAGSGAAEPGQGEEAGAVVTAIELSKAGGGRTRVVLKFSKSVDPASFLLANPDRAVIDLPDVSFAPGLTAGARKAGLAVSSYRFGQLEAGKSRIVLDLTGPVRIAAAKFETVDGQPRYAVEFEAVSRDEFLASLQPSNPRSPAPREAAPAGSSPEGGKAGDDRPLIVLDPGHGGIDAGARGAAQANEKEVVLAFALTLEQKLQSTGRYRVLLTRREDVFVSLPERVRIARQAGAKLFLSIHADTLNQRWVEGATVYTVSDRASDAHAAKLAEKENEADRLAGVEGNEDMGDVSDILFDLTRRETRTFSHYFARSLVAYWKDAGKLNKNPIRSAGFRVLMAPDVPSVLLELGYLSSRTEAIKLSQPEWRATAAASVLRSVDEFFEPRSARTGGLAPAPETMPK